MAQDTTARPSIVGDSASSPAPSAEPTHAPPLIGEMRVAILAPMHFLYIDFDTTMATLPQNVGPAIEQLIDAAAEDEIRFAGALIFRYPQGLDLNGHFTMQIGFPVMEVEAPEGTEVQNLPPFKCATVLYTGPMDHVKESFTATYQAIRKAGLTPTGEFREAYLYWEGVDSPNNVTQVQIAIE